jgi:ornithine cyclodeaminase/alanine dehydrogenase-like protein (mu-crystallin family)
MQGALEVVEQTFREQAEGNVVAHAPFALALRKGSLRFFTGGLLRGKKAGVRLGPTGGLGSRHHGESRWVSVLYDTMSGELLCVAADPFGNLRSGAVMGVAAKNLAPPRSNTIGMIGTGKNALSILQGVVLVRPIKEIMVYSRNEERREAFASKASEALGLKVSAAGSAEEAVRNKDIILTSTNSPKPVVCASWIGTETYLASFGWPSEVDKEIFALSKMLVVSSKEQERTTVSSGPHPLIQLIEQGQRSWDQVRELGEVIVSNDREYEQDGITVFRESGGGFSDIALAAWVYQEAGRRQIGHEIDLQR